LKLILERAGLPDCRFHDLRHSCASLLLSFGVRLKQIQEILGHSNFQITADVYSHLEKSELEDAMRKWDDILADSPAERVARKVPTEKLEIIQ
jgi:integrase